MENLELNTTVYNIETDKIVKNQEMIDEIQCKLNDDIISDFDKQTKVDDSILDETSAEVENDNMSFLLNAA